MSSWDPARVKSHIRITAQRLANLQEKQESAARHAQAEIASLLAQHNLLKARARAEKLCLWDIRLDVLGKLEMYCDSLLGSFNELKETPPTKESPIFEPVCCILFAGHRTRLRELIILRDILIHRFGRPFLQWVGEYPQEFLAPNVFRWLHVTSIPPAELKAFLRQIGQSQGVDWSPPSSPNNRLSTLGDLLDNENLSIDLSRLRALSSQGIPYECQHLRPWIWRVLLSNHTNSTAQLKSDLRTKRDVYYELLRRFLTSLSDNPPSETLSPPDACILRTAKFLSGLPPSLTATLLSDPNESLPHPLLSTSDSDHPLPSIDKRLRSIDPSCVYVSFSVLPADSVQATSLPPSATTHTAMSLSPHHFMALLRILCVHSSAHPSQSLSTPVIATTIYSCLCRDVDSDSLQHIEADTFWMLQEMMGETSDLQDETEVQNWMERISSRLKEIDDELWDALEQKGLNPSLPHFSYRWLGPLFGYTLPIEPLLIIWDAILAAKARTSDTNYKLTMVIEVAVALLICSKTSLMRAGRYPVFPRDLWDDQDLDPPPNQPSEKESDIAFADGLSLLQKYPIDELGGPFKVLEIVRELPTSTAHQFPSTSTGFPSSVSSAFWRSAPPRKVGSAVEPVVVITPIDENDETSHKSKPSLSDRLKATVFRGISNESAMEPDPSPSPSPPPIPVQPISPTPQASLNMKSQSETLNEEDAKTTGHGKSTSLWDRAANIRRSETAATLSKLGKGLGAKVVSSWSATEPDSPRSVATAPELFRPEINSPPASITRSNRDSYIPPDRPSVFRSPRESFSPYSRHAILHANNDGYLSPDDGRESSHSRTGSVTSALKTLTGIASPVPKKKTGPKPLLLNASRLMTPETSPLVTRSAATSPNPHQWSDVYRDKAKAAHRTEDSMSSISTFSNPLSFDGPSRVIPLKRGSLLTRSKGTIKVAPASRHRTRSSKSSIHDSASEFEYLSDVVLARYRTEQGPDSPLTAVSSPPVPTPRTSLLSQSKPIKIQRDSIDGLPYEQSDENDSENGLESLEEKRIDAPSTPQKSAESSHQASDLQQTPRVRSKKYANRIANLYLQQSLVPPNSDVDIESVTPKANAFEPTETLPARARSLSIRSESDAEKGDDEEGYDDILSGY